MTGEVIAGAGRDSRGQFSCLFVGEMSAIAQDAINKELRSSAALFHSHIVIEFQGQYVHAREGIDQGSGSTAEVGGIPD